MKMGTASPETIARVLYQVRAEIVREGARSHRKLVVAVLALELAARGDLVRIMVAAHGADSFAIRLGPAHLAERGVGRIFASLVDRAQGSGARCCRKKKVLCHCLRPRCLCIVYSALTHLGQGHIYLL